MAEATKTKKVELPDIMLAMDVVDTLRHRQSMVDRELDTEAYDQALIEKVRKIYADQGLEVTDEIIDRGVAALREDRFTYTPPKWSPKVALARIYVNRGRWTKVGGIIVALLLVVWLVYRFTVVGPIQREKKQQTRQLTQVWEQFQATKKSDNLTRVGDRLYRQAKQDLEAGKSAGVSSAISQLTSLAQMPDQLATLRAGIVKESREKTATAKGDRLYQDAMAALDRGDVPSAQKATRSLQTLHRQLKTEYALQIVSRPNTRSGIWRHPQNNPSARNYYIIVEAVTSDGKRIALPITSEEDGKTSTAEMWGIRVPDRVFNQIRRDKMDNGIIDKNRFGLKQRGFITPEYLYPTAGGMITKW